MVQALLLLLINVALEQLLQQHCCDVSGCVDIPVHYQVLATFLP
jgi:hypothetical protein